MVQYATPTNPQITATALSDLRQALELYGAAHTRCAQSTEADEQDLRGLLSLAEELLNTTAGRYARLEEGLGGI